MTNPNDNARLVVYRHQWISLCFSKPVVRRALLYAVVVGAILIMINHGDALLRGEVDLTRLFKMSLTALVPYTVSTLSSVSAMWSFLSKPTP